MSDVVTFSTRFASISPTASRQVHIPIKNTIRTPVGFIRSRDIELLPIALQISLFVEHYVARNYPKTLFQKGTLIVKNGNLPSPAHEMRISDHTRDFVVEIFGYALPG